jgi:type II secretory pathway pseudopilin PulG
MRVRRRSGFALLTVLAMIVVILIVAVAAVTSVAVVSDHERVERAAKVLMQITDSSRYSVVRFQSDVGEYPGKLSHLRTAPASGQKDICYTAYSTAELDAWGQPYVDRSFTTTGLWTGIGLARDSLAKDPVAGTPSAGTPHALVILIDDVDQRDARLLNTLIDPAGEATPSTLGRVRWGSANSEGRVLMQFRKTIIQC